MTLQDSWNNLQFGMEGVKNLFSRQHVAKLLITPSYLFPSHLQFGCNLIAAPLVSLQRTNIQAVWLMVYAADKLAETDFVMREKYYTIADKFKRTENVYFPITPFFSITERRL